MDWANRFGGPGTNLAGPNRGAITLVANCPKGEYLGPAATRSRNPMASAHSSHSLRKTSVSAVSTTTMPATERAAYSLTGFGKVKYLLAIGDTHCVDTNCVDTHCVDLAEQTGGDIEDEPADPVRVRDEFTAGDPVDGLPDVGIRIAERFG